MSSKPFDTFERFSEMLRSAPGPDAVARASAASRNDRLTKPPGALGRLEELAIWMAGWQGGAVPVLERPRIVVFAGNHGVAARGVSAFPPEVTAQMVANFQAGGAAINQFAVLAGATLDVVPLSLDEPTGDFTEGPAMNVEGCIEAMTVGWSTVDAKSDALVVGEMGIGNTTAAAAIAASLEGGDWIGRGTGVDDAGLARKRAAVESGLAANADAVGNPLATLAAFGGREIAAMAGAIAAARVHRVPVVLDGFIASSAALVLHRAVPGALDHVVAGHVSAEEAHPRLLAVLGKEPLLSLGLRLGEGSGAALALQVIRGALACHGGMATFDEAGVSDG